MSSDDESDIDSTFSPDDESDIDSTFSPDDESNPVLLSDDESDTVPVYRNQVVVPRGVVDFPTTTSDDNLDCDLHAARHKLRVSLDGQTNDYATTACVNVVCDANTTAHIITFPPGTLTKRLQLFLAEKKGTDHAENLRWIASLGHIFDVPVTAGEFDALTDHLGIVFRNFIYSHPEHSCTHTFNRIMNF
jgi:hypothetical protein